MDTGGVRDSRGQNSSRIGLEFLELRMFRGDQRVRSPRIRQTGMWEDLAGSRAELGG